MAEELAIATNNGRCDAESLVNLGTSLDTRGGFSVSQFLARVQIRNRDRGERYQNINNINNKNNNRESWRSVMCTAGPEELNARTLMTSCEVYRFYEK